MSKEKELQKLIEYYGQDGFNTICNELTNSKFYKNIPTKTKDSICESAEGVIWLISVFKE